MFLQESPGYMSLLFGPLRVTLLLCLHIKGLCPINQSNSIVVNSVRTGGSSSSVKFIENSFQHLPKCNYRYRINCPPKYSTVPRTNMLNIRVCTVLMLVAIFSYRQAYAYRIPSADFNVICLNIVYICKKEYCNTCVFYFQGTFDG